MKRVKPFDVVEAYRTKGLAFQACDFGLRPQQFITLGADDGPAFVGELRPDHRNSCCPLGALAAGQPYDAELALVSMASRVARMLELPLSYVAGFMAKVDGCTFHQLPREHKNEDAYRGFIDATRVLLALRQANVKGTEFPTLPG